MGVKNELGIIVLGGKQLAEVVSTFIDRVPNKCSLSLPLSNSAAPHSSLEL